ncbi:hypothetical protein J4D99_05245 [Siccationidurans ginsengisoli]|uniref:hypothetical protein n=1 Tax=unclassified Hymenobacter TaxID=2615202 RepID=UPI001AAE0B6F|nr:MULTISPECIES: hypothetical protein [unclassified Hymenobacter]MBO2030789.1 hypothetical protein [Hymenobacter sp. BT559]
MPAGVGRGRAGRGHGHYHGWRGLFGRWQGLDWLFGLSLARLLSDWGVPVTAVGNNIAAWLSGIVSCGQL